MNRPSRGRPLCDLSCGRRSDWDVGTLAAGEGAVSPALRWEQRYFVGSELVIEVGGDGNGRSRRSIVGLLAGSTDDTAVAWVLMKQMSWEFETRLKTGPVSTWTWNCFGIDGGDDGGDDRGVFRDL